MSKVHKATALTPSGANDTIKAGDRVSWRLSSDFPRVFGHVHHITRTCSRLTGNHELRVHVTDDNGVPRIIPARFITKEVG